MDVEIGGERRPLRAQGYLDFVMVPGGVAGGGGVPSLDEMGVDGEENTVRLRRSRHDRGQRREGGMRRWKSVATF